MWVKCFAYDNKLRDCIALKEVHPECGTTRCPFFKPQGCKDYIRVEKRGEIIFCKGKEIYTGEYE